LAGLVFQPLIVEGVPRHSKVHRKCEVFNVKHPERFGGFVVKLAYEFRIAGHHFMKRGVASAVGGGHRKRRKSVAQILRASYEQFANDKETLTALKAVLGQGVKVRS
jgi:hypothetical protein